MLSNEERRYELAFEAGRRAFPGDRANERRWKGGDRPDTGAFHRRIATELASGSRSRIRNFGDQHPDNRRRRRANGEGCAWPSASSSPPSW